MCRTARKGGNASLLWPEGCSSIEEVPIDLIRSVNHAFKILDWFENLMKEEIPPEWMWPIDHELELWFEEVERKRDERYPSHGDSSGDESGGHMMVNELAKDLRGR